MPQLEGAWQQAGDMAELVTMPWRLCPCSWRLGPGAGGLSAGRDAGAATSPPWLSEAESEAGLGSAYPETGDTKESLLSCAQKSCLVVYRADGQTEERQDR